MDTPEPLDTDVAIETPEHIVFRHRVAGPARRFLAYAIDLLVCYGVFAIVGVVVLLASVGAGQVVDAAKDGFAAAAGILLVLLFVIQWVYFAALEGWRGTTPGKAALGLRVVTAVGRPVAFSAAALRNVLRAADALPLAYFAGLLSFAGLVSMSVTRRFQRLGDLVAGTMVVVSERARATTPVVLWPPAQPRELALLPREVRLDADERQAIDMFLRRRERLGPARVHELAAMLTPLVREHCPGLAVEDPSRALALLYDRAESAPARIAAPALMARAVPGMGAGAVKEASFSAQRRDDWDSLDTLVRRAQGGRLRNLGADGPGRVSPLYLDVCADLARAQAARYGAPLVDYLQGLTAASHAVLYGRHAKTRWTSGGGSPRRTLRAALEAFPRAVRRHRTAMLVSLLLFFLPFFGGLLATMADPRFALNIVPESMLRPLVHAYREGFDRGRGSGLDAAMAGFYVNNNVGIALRCFATGLAFGIGSVFYLVENGLVTGATMGYVGAHGGGANIFTFVVSHGSLELGAIVLAGGAGLSLGWSLAAPGDRTRLAALQTTAKSVVVVVFGAAIMLFMAAAIEGFWSASSVPSTVKRLTGAVIALSLTAYVAFGGRRPERAEVASRPEAESWT